MTAVAGAVHGAGGAEWRDDHHARRRLRRPHGFDYTVSDGALSDVGHVAITGTPVNDPPVAVDDVATTAEDTPPPWLAGRWRPTTPTSTVQGHGVAVARPQHGTVALAGGTVTFTP
ncbi:MAG: hypothetical protein IPH80_29640 [Myxococcales bacterium]|nr:hypothetical protein [Myxococcales bacterium]